MSATLRSIHIENFRSIKRLSLPTRRLSIFVGKNDCGKSNILRAINLFFNGVTNPRQPFIFEDDYNLFVPERAKVAKEVVVRLELDIPASYHQTNGEIIVWEKRWRSSGEHSNKYWGIRVSTNRRRNEVRTEVRIPERSNVHDLLRKIEFDYVPAIKDSNYFNELRGRIYRTIAEVATRTFRSSSSAFEESIGEHLADLTEDINSELGFATKLALPRDLSPIFQRLDFLGGEKSISLDSRGDGIKTRHIPIILAFMAEKKRSMQGRGAAPYSFIWAYEEPENNLEFASALELAVQLSGYSDDGVAQILLTTHSPVFYDLSQANDLTSCAHVFRETDTAGTEVSAIGSEVDEKMGTLALLKPRMTELVQEMKEQLEAKSAAEQLAQENRCKIFVEGESDRLILSRCADVFFPTLAGNVDFVTKLEGAGHNYVVDMLLGWRAHHKHHPSRPKAAGILDWDAQEQKTKWNNEPSNISSAKCFLYPKPPHAIAALQAGYRLSVTLEILYSRTIWNWANDRGYLEDTARSEVYPADLVERILKGETDVENADDQYSIYVNRKFRVGTKVTAATHVASFTAPQVRTELPHMEAFLHTVFTYLGLQTA